SSPEGFTALPGRGLEATVEGHTMLIGTRHLFNERSMSYEALQQQLETLEGQGKTIMIVAIDGAVVGLLAVADTVKVGSAEAIRQLHSYLGRGDPLRAAHPGDDEAPRLGDDEGPWQGVWMITGDNSRTAQAIAAQVGIPAEHVLAEVLPEDK